MGIPSRRWLLAGLSIAAACAPVAPPTRPSPARFYASRDYGSESQFNPLSAIINDGFDFLHSAGTDPHVFSRDYTGAFRNVMTSLLQADRTYRHYGAARAARNEWFPLTAEDGSGGGSWVPNYEYHLFGSGMVSVRMEEWYAQHGFSHPRVGAIATMSAAHVLNEVVENGTWRGLNQDAATDLLIFDPLGMIIWRIDAMQRFFSGPLQMTNWPWQPSIEVNTGMLQNSGQQYMLRGRLPGTQQWRVMYLFGMGGVLGRRMVRGHGHFARYHLRTRNPPQVREFVVARRKARGARRRRERAPQKPSSARTGTATAVTTDSGLR